MIGIQRKIGKERVREREKQHFFPTLEKKELSRGKRNIDGWNDMDLVSFSLRAVCLPWISGF